MSTHPKQEGRLLPADYRRILTLVVQGRSYTDITTTVGRSRRNVAKVRKIVDELELTRDNDITDDQLAARFPDRSSAVSDRYLTPTSTRCSPR